MNRPGPEGFDAQVEEKHSPDKAKPKLFADQHAGNKG
jgi:hypothetical protein